MRSKSPELRMALKLQHCLERRQAVPDHPLDECIKVTVSYAQLLEQQFQRLHYARRRGWTSAIGQVREQLLQQFRLLEHSMTNTATQINRVSTLPGPTLRDLYEEICHLRREFSEVELDLKAGVVAAITDDIELRGVYLGPFRIELHLERLAKRADSSAFEVTALDSHPAASNEDVTHPHVRDGEVCAGDATVPIASALAEGRLVDAFLALNSVLHTYNPHSPYVSLDQWDGNRCSDCGGVFDETYFCNGCEEDFCDDCATSCDICDATYCNGCLEEDPESGHMCCRGCRDTCGECGRIVETDHFESDSGLCPQCLEKQRKEQTNSPESTNKNPLQEQEINHEPDHYERADGDGTKSVADDNAATTAGAAA
jgi:hypothetical protein